MQSFIILIPLYELIFRTVVLLIFSFLSHYLFFFQITFYLFQLFTTISSKSLLQNQYNSIREVRVHHKFKIDFFSSQFQTRLSVISSYTKVWFYINTIWQLSIFWTDIQYFSLKKKTYLSFQIENFKNWPWRHPLN